MAGFKITSISAFISVDPDDGDEGILAATMNDGTIMPLMAADSDRLKSLWPIAKEIQKLSGIRVELRQFSDGEVLGVIDGKEDV